MHLRTTRPPFRFIAFQRGAAISSHHLSVAVIQKPITLVSNIPHAFSQLSQAAHAKRLQRCNARRKDAEEPPISTGGALTRKITRDIRDSQRLQELEDIVDQWGNTFDSIHTSAAFVKVAKLAQDRPPVGPTTTASICSKLVRIWHGLYPQANEQSLTNVLWASSKLQISDPKLWETLEVFTQRAGHATSQNLSNVVYALALHASRNEGLVPGFSKEELQHAVASVLEHAYVLVTHPTLEGVSAQDVAGILWGIGKLGSVADTTTLSALLRALVRPQVAELADSQVWSNSMYGLSQLVEVCDLQAVIDRRICERLFSEGVMATVAGGQPQHVANTALALVRLSSAHKPAISRALAQQCGLRLLQGSVAANLAAWNSQDLCNTLWACAKLQIKYQPFLDAVVDVVLRHLPTATMESLKQYAWAFSTLGQDNLEYMRSVAKWSQQHLDQSQVGTPGGSLLGLAAVVSWSVANLDMQGLAAQAVALVKSRAVVAHLQRKAATISAGDAAMLLWQVHTWLLQHALLDGQGLSSCLTSEQLEWGKIAHERYLADDNGAESG